MDEILLWALPTSSVELSSFTMANFHSPSNLYYRNTLIHCHSITGLISLTDLWKAEQGLASKRPLAWIRQEVIQKLLKRLSEQTGMPIWLEAKPPESGNQSVIISIPGMLETSKTSHGIVTYTMPELALVYAQFLSENCYNWALQQLPIDPNLAAILVVGTTLDGMGLFDSSSEESSLSAGWEIPTVPLSSLTPSSSKNDHRSSCTDKSKSVATSRPSLTLV